MHTLIGGYWLPNGTSLTVPSALESRVVRAPGRMRAWCLGQGITTVTDLALRTGLTDAIVVHLLDADRRFGRVGEHVWTVPDTDRNVVRSRCAGNWPCVPTR